MTENVTEQHRALKAVVIVLGALIVICLGIIATTVAKRLAAPDYNDPLPLPQIPQPGHSVFFGDVQLAIPEGAQVVQMSDSGDRLLLLLESARGHRQIHVADARTGVYLGTYHLTPGVKPSS